MNPKFKLVFLIVLLSCIKMHTQSWEWIHPLTTTNSLQHIAHVTNSIWVAGGESGIMLRTTDNGQSWRQIFIPAGERTIQDIKFLNEQVGYAVTSVSPGFPSSARILKTSDSGNSWQVIGELENTSFRKLIIVAPGTLYAFGPSSYFVSNNDGIDWENRSSLMPAESFYISDVHFFTSINGIVTTSLGDMCTTTNGGLEWTVTTSAIPAAITCIAFPDSQIGYAGTSSPFIYKTTNKGQSWLPQELPNGGNTRGINFRTKGDGYAVGAWGYIYHTANGGSSWSLDFGNQNYQFLLNSVAIESNGNAIACGTEGSVAAIGTNGWELMQNTSQYNILGLYISGSRAFAIDNQGGVFHSSDLSQWSRQQIPYFEFQELKILRFSSADTGVIFGMGDTILITTNGGAVWNKAWVNMGIGRVTSARFQSGGLGHAALTSGQFLKSTDFGLSWQTVATNISFPIDDFHFITQEIGFLVSSSAGVYKTTDGGSSWVAISGFSGFSLSRFSFVSSAIGYVTGPYGLFKTTNSGQSWSQLPPPPSINNRDYIFKDELTGYIIGAGIQKTTDGGQNWTFEESGYAGSSNLNTIFLSETGTVYAAGEKEAILRERTNAQSIGSVTLVYPPEQSQNINLSPNLKWRRTPGAVGYRIQVALDGGFTQLLFNSTSVDTFLSLPTDTLDFGNYYFWRVRAVSEFGIGTYSAPWTFQTENPAPFYGDTDLNAAVQAYDAGMILRYVVGDTLLGKRQKRNANVTFDDSITAYDASVLLRYVVGLVPELPFQDQENAKLLFTEINTEVSVEPGKMYIPVLVENIYSLFALQGDVSVSGTEIELTDIIWSPSFGDWQKNILVYKGQIHFALCGVFPVSINTNTSICTLVVKISHNFSGDAEVSFSHLKYNTKSITQTPAIKLKSRSVANEGQPTKFILHQNYPNPCNPTTTITYELAESSNVTLTVYDVAGREVALLKKNWEQAGKYNTVFNASILASGIYFAELRGGKHTARIKINVIK